LSKKYSKAQNLINEMTQRIYKQRPDCSKILRKKESWALAQNNLNSKELNKLKWFNEKLIKSRYGDENFSIYTILDSKLMHKSSHKTYK